MSAPRPVPRELIDASPTVSLEELLRERTAEGTLVETLPDGKVRCHACGHRCLIPEGMRGVCKVRYNKEGALRVPRGYVGALQVDPIEKKPFFHALPGSLALSFGMLGCDFHCGYCQNWITSQALRDSQAVAPITELDADSLVQMARKHGAPVLCSTYNEPLITSEWAVEVFKPAREAGLMTGYVSNGNATPEVLEYLKPWVDLYKVDLKGFDDRNYRKLGGVLQNVLDSIESLHRMGFWVEIVSLLVPGFNDEPAEIRDIAQFLAGVSVDIPWHVTAFHSDYKMQGTGNTPTRTLLRAAEIGREEGLHYVYAGNLPGRVGEWEDTRCPSCNATVIRRSGFHVKENRILDGQCPDCSTPIPGRWRASGVS
ncbi:MAG: AmmeMemoRadiSam system radical SAM enzyme [Planctomycetota bacterium]|nr:AmmeMemoRadiSam system radical SAM enzyme [Planctomycetota bacterium]